MASDFFGQFLLTPSSISPASKATITRLLDLFVETYDAVAKERGIEPRSLGFRRPIYMLVSEGDDGLWVMYTNDNAVRGATQWYYLDLRSQGLIADASAPLSDLARREIGLNAWKGFFLSRLILDITDQTQLNREVKSVAEQVFQDDLEQDLRRRRLVQINPIFKGRDFAVEPDLCFVLMPFRDELKPVYDDHLKKSVEQTGMRCQRADDIFRNTAIIEDIWEHINTARLIIADLTGKNPNVFYEAGIAHTVGKDVILITQSIEDVPFDLRHLRHIEYAYTPRGMEAFEQQLRNTIATLTGRTS